MNQKGFANILIVILGVIIVGGAAGYFYWSQKTVAPKEQTQITNTPPAQQTPPSNNNPSQTPPPNETANWKTYRNNEYGFELKYPSKYTVASGWRWGNFDVHFVTPSDTGVHVSGESVNGNFCFLGFCNTPAKSQLTVNGVNWDYLGQQGYADAWESTEGRYIYRVTYGQYRFYVHFDNDDQENKLVMQAFRFTK